MHDNELAVFEIDTCIIKESVGIEIDEIDELEGIGVAMGGIPMGSVQTNAF